MKTERDFFVINTIDGGNVRKSNAPPIKSAGIRALFDQLDALHDGRGAEQWGSYIVNEALKHELSTDERRALRNSELALRSCLSVLGGLDTRDRFMVARALSAMAVISRYADPGDAQWERFSKIFRHSQAGIARRRRAQSAEELALNAAIQKARGEGPVERPWKEADASLDQVNAFLREAGFAPVKVDVVRRRLEKFPRS